MCSINMRLLTEGRSEKYLKKLVGRMDIEDGLKRLDKLTQEEGRMAAAENLKVTHAVDERVKGVADTVTAIDNRVAGVDDHVAYVDERVVGVGDKVAGVDERVAGIDDRVQRTANDVDGIKRWSSLNLTNTDYGTLPALVGNQLRENIHKWLSPPDPSTNYNIACGIHHKKSATWFFQGSVFQEWKSTGSLLWIHGKRLSHTLSNLTPSDTILHCSWLG
jgi:archaellum component FlaC